MVMDADSVDRPRVPRDGDGAARGRPGPDRGRRRFLRRSRARACSASCSATSTRATSAYIARRGGQVFVLTGTASLFRTYALKAVADARGNCSPAIPASVYDTLALTEDNEMTLALKTLGARMVSPMQCRVTTELMPTWRALWRQRMRWQRGALENIGAYGLTRATLRYWLQQIAIGYGTIALNAYLLLMTITLLAADSFQLVWFWVGDRLDLRRRTDRHRLGRRLARHAARASRWSSRSPTTSSCRPSTSNRCSTSRPAGAAGWNYVPRQPAAHRERSSTDHASPASCSPPTSSIGLVPGARHVRRDQHAHLRRAQPRETHPTSTRVMRPVRRLFLIFVIAIACIDGVVLRAPTRPAPRAVRPTPPASAAGRARVQRPERRPRRPASAGRAARALHALSP